MRIMNNQLYNYQVDLIIKSFSKIYLNKLKNKIEFLQFCLVLRNIKYILKNIFNMYIIKYELKYNIIIFNKLNRYNNILFNLYRKMILINIYSKLVILSLIYQKIEFILNPSINLPVIILPTKLKKITVIKSPHIFKTSRDQFQFNYYKIRIRLPMLLDYSNITKLNTYLKTLKLSSTYEYNYEINSYIQI